MDKIRGVNLGNWLVLEKWMSPELFAGVEAEDETDLCAKLPRAELMRRLKEHRDTYITLEDFKWIAARGVNVIRLPVPHFVFDDCEPYVGCVEYVDKAFGWAKEAGVRILIDLHTARDCQNGFDNGGICGVCKWHTKPENIQHTVDLLEKLAGRYGDLDALFGIELLNEPVSEEVFQFSQKRYSFGDDKRGEGSSFVPLTVLYDFYKRGYRAIRKHMGEDKVVMFHDGFRPNAWYDFMADPELKNVMMDTHIYLAMSPLDPAATAADNMKLVFEKYAKQVALMQSRFPTVVGEWCLAHKNDQAVTDTQKALSHRLVADAQLSVWEQCAGYFFWSYKLLSKPLGWDFIECVEKGYLPDNLRMI